MNTKLTPERIALRIEDLPPIPSSVADVLQIANDPCSSSADAERIVGRDAALTAKVLRLTNSAAYCFRRRVETVREAVALLGMRTLRDTSATMAAAALFGQEDSGILDINGYETVDVTMDAAYLEPGDHVGTLTLNSNDPLNPVIAIPVDFHVGVVEAADSMVQPDVLEAGDGVYGAAIPASASNPVPE